MIGALRLMHRLEENENRKYPWEIGRDYDLPIPVINRGSNLICRTLIPHESSARWKRANVQTEMQSGTRLSARVERERGRVWIVRFVASRGPRATGNYWAFDCKLRLYLQFTLDRPLIPYPINRRPIRSVSQYLLSALIDTARKFSLVFPGHRYPMHP